MFLASTKTVLCILANSLTPITLFVDQRFASAATAGEAWSRFPLDVRLGRRGE
jgi:hypothetical protein